MKTYLTVLRTSPSLCSAAACAAVLAGPPLIGCRTAGTKPPRYCLMPSTETTKSFRIACGARACALGSFHRFEASLVVSPIGIDATGERTDVTRRLN